MVIKILLEEKTLLITKYMRMNSKRIIVKKTDIKFANLQCKMTMNNDLIVRVLFKNFQSDYIFNTSDILFKTSEIVLTGSLFDPLFLYNQGYVDNFKLLTDKKEKIKWYELNEKQKYNYLRGCCMLNGVRESIDNTDSVIIINLSKAKTDLDVYYEIGKSFFTSYGYFGTEFHSFRDCLISIDKSMKERETMPILKIKGYKNFKKYFVDNILFEDFYKEFETSGFKILNS